MRTETPTKDVFGFMADLRHFVEWDPRVSSSVQIDGDGPGLGANYKVEASGASLVYSVIEFDAPERMVAEAKRPSCTARAR